MERALHERFRRHAASLAANQRSPLYTELMNAGADDAEQGGVVAELFDGIPLPSGAVPQLRLMAAMHQLVLSGRAPELARFYPSAGGDEPPENVWSAAAPALRENFDWIRSRLELTVQTNEPGRSAVLFGVLLWLTEQYQRPIRLLEIGASAGLNMVCDRYCYIVDGEALGDPASPIRFEEPWEPRPAINIPEAAQQLTIASRAACDRAPLNPCDPEHRLRLISYIWPDEPARMERIRIALELAASAGPFPVETGNASAWLPRRLSDREDGELTVIWHSVVRQYVPATEWAAIDEAVSSAWSDDPERPVVWAGMEPGFDHTTGLKLTVRVGHEQPSRLMARCGDHGPPVIWQNPPAEWSADSAR